MNLREAAIKIADKYHNEIVGQKRKYTGEKYTVHTNAVAETYASFFPNDIVGQAAAELHDGYEDTPLTPELLKTELTDLGIDINTPEVQEMMSLIVELTDVYVPRDFPTKNRKERKFLECERLSKISPKGKTLKCCDLLDNSASIVKHDKNFARVYLPEKLEIVGVLAGDIPADLLNRAMNQVLDGYAKLGMTMTMISGPSNTN